MYKRYVKLNLIFTTSSLLLSFALFILYIDYTIPIFYNYLRNGEYINMGLYLLLMFIVTGFVYGSIIYHLTRIGHIVRKEREILQKSSDLPPLTILVPSYKEEVKVIEQTLLSLGLLNYPDKRLVLLIDNPPNTNDGKDKELLDSTYNMVTHLDYTFDLFKRLLEKSIIYLEKNENEKEIREKFLKDVSKIESWLLNIKSKYNKDHVDEFFRNKIIGEYIKEITKLKRNTSNTNEIRKNYKQLQNFFNTKITYFERKKYINLSHEANKAMNINSYIGLMGNGYNTIPTRRGMKLQETNIDKADIVVSETEYILTVDADSLVRKDYAKIMVSHMQANKNIAVAQTPYCSYKNTPNKLERIAGATTDIQYNIHQGFDFFNASFWVGANAVLRKKALDDILVEFKKGKHTIKRYIQDRTVIEDTESSIDLRVLGWDIFNYPKKLAFSATPSDFGSLVIQRRRWANGGLIIFPKLLGYFIKNVFKISVVTEFFVRSHYLLSIFLVNYGFILLLTLPFDRNLINYLLPLLAIPYLVLYSIDLKKIGYKWYEFFAVYSFNLLLVPVNIVGVNKSLEQFLFNKKIPFLRTPKIGSRTPASLDILVFEYLLLLLLSFSVLINTVNQNYFITLFSIFNLIALIYGIRLMGFKSSILDIKNQALYYLSNVKNFLINRSKNKKVNNLKSLLQ